MQLILTIRWLCSATRPAAVMSLVIILLIQILPSTGHPAQGFPTAGPSIPPASLDSIPWVQIDREKAQAEAYGSRLYDLMYKTMPSEQSPWKATDWNELANYGSESALGHLGESRAWQLPPLLGAPFKALRLGSGLREAIVLRHDKVSKVTYEIDGRKVVYNPTYGQYANVFATSPGIIATIGALPPQAAVKMYQHDSRKSFKGGKIVPLSSWGDVVLLEYLHYAQSLNSGDIFVPNIEHVFQLSITDEITKTIINDFLRGKLSSPVAPAWPGVVLADADSAFPTLLGTPVGSMVADMLIQHRRELGHRVIERIGIFGEGMKKHAAGGGEAADGGMVSLYFKIGKYTGLRHPTGLAGYPNASAGTVPPAWVPEPEQTLGNRVSGKAWWD